MTYLTQETSVAAGLPVVTPENRGRVSDRGTDQSRTRQQQYQGGFRVDHEEELEPYALGILKYHDQQQHDQNAQRPALPPDRSNSRS